MPPRKRQRGAAPTINWDEQPVVKTFETDFGRLRTVAYPMPKKGTQSAKIFVLDDEGGLIKTHT